MVNYFQTNPYKFPQMKGLGFLGFLLEEKLAVICFKYHCSSGRQPGKGREQWIYWHSPNCLV